MTSPRVLLSAYQCAPGLGSVSQIGWEWYSRLSQEVTTTLVTHSRNREALESAGAPIPGSEVIYIDTEWFAGPLYRLACRLFPRSQHAVFLLSSLDFFVYDSAAVRKLRKRRHDWDVVHAVTPVSPLASTRLHRLGPPLIVGPWNGGLRSPKAFRTIMREDSGWIYEVRVLRRLINLLTGCTRRAALIFSATKSTDLAIPKRAPVCRMLENGVDLQLFRPGTEKPTPSFSEPLRVLYVGRLIPAKGLSLLLEAVDRVRNEFPLHLTIVGDGPLAEQLRLETAERDLNATVTFTGAKSLPEIASFMADSHLFCLPSVRESGGAVLLEAMAAGLPVLGLKYGGPGELVDEQVGMTLSADGPEQLITSLVAAFRDAFRRPQEWMERGRAGRLRAEQIYGWDCRIQQAKTYYQQVAGRRAHE